jgi:hypothetical protein
MAETEWTPRPIVVEDDTDKDITVTVGLTDRGNVVIDSEDGDILLLSHEEAEELCSNIRAALAHARGEKIK